MKNKKHIVGVVLTLISVIVILMLLFVRLIPVEQREPEIDIDVDLLLPNELSKDILLILISSAAMPSLDALYSKEKI